MLEITERRKNSTVAHHMRHSFRGVHSWMMGSKIFSICYAQTNSNMKADTNTRFNTGSHCNNTEARPLQQAKSPRTELATSSPKVTRLNEELWHQQNKFIFTCMTPSRATPWQWTSLGSATQLFLTAQTSHHKFHAPIPVAPTV